MEKIIFKVTNSTYFYNDLLDPSDIYKPPDGVRQYFEKGAEPKLYSWNNFGTERIQKSRKPPSWRPSLRKTLCTDMGNSRINDEKHADSDGDIDSFTNSIEFSDKTTEQNIAKDDLISHNKYLANELIQLREKLNDKLRI